MGVYRRQANGDVATIFGKFSGLRRELGGFKSALKVERHEQPYGLRGIIRGRVLAA